MNGVKRGLEVALGALIAVAGWAAGFIFLLGDAPAFTSVISVLIGSAGAIVARHGLTGE